MKNHGVLLVVVCVAAIVVWQLLPAPAIQAENVDVPAPAGFTVTPLGMWPSRSPAPLPGAQRVTIYKVQVIAGARWPDLRHRLSVWDFCYVQEGEITLKDPDKTTTVISDKQKFPSFRILPRQSYELSNQTKQLATYYCWEVYGQ